MFFMWPMRVDEWDADLTDAKGEHGLDRFTRISALWAVILN